MGKEIESKFVCSAETFEAIKAAYPNASPIEMETTYYDTFDGKLNNLQWTLRTRLENGVSVCTLKTPGDKKNPDVRNEWETEGDDLKAFLNTLPEIDVLKPLKDINTDDLVQVCGARFTRLAQKLEYEGTVVELALDKGVLIGGHLTEPIQEVEVELKDGSEEGMNAFIAQLREKFELTPEKKSKYKRAMALAIRAREK